MVNRKGMAVMGITREEAVVAKRTFAAVRTARDTVGCVQQVTQWNGVDVAYVAGQAWSLTQLNLVPEEN